VKVYAYLAAVMAVALATVATLAMHPWMGPSVSLLFFPAVVTIAMHGGYGPSILATVLSTGSLAFFVIPPRYSFDVGSDDGIRLAVFAAVAIATAWLSAARKQAEDAQRRALTDLQGAIATLRKVSGWPTFVDAGLNGGSRRLLAHAATVVGCARAVAVWETEDEPWLSVAESDAVSVAVQRYAPTDITPLADDDAHRGATLACETPHGDAADASAPFELEHLKGRVYFIDLAADDRDVIPLAEVVAREVGNSLEQLYVHDRLQQLAVREDRIRVARDLHDGVLQSLTGIRLQLQAFADRPEAPANVADHLLAMERAIAIEQRELRRFIEDLKPSSRAPGAPLAFACVLEDLRDRLSVEWQGVVSARVTPPHLELDANVEDSVRLMIREAAVNAFKHARPSRVSVDVQLQETGELTIRVANDGRGFPFRGRLTHQALASAPGMPVSLRERVEECGGTLAIESEANGSTVDIVLPSVHRLSRA
jgi:signal transduction histidine kinase